MQYTKKELKEGINLHFIDTPKFKTNLVAVFLTLPLNKETITLNALVPSILRRGTNNLPTMEEISIKLEELYGSAFDCGIEKRGDNAVVKFYVENVNQRFLNTKEEVLKQCIELILDIIFNPILENGVFRNEYVETEKETIRQLIDSKIDNKDIYALERAIEEMFKDEPFSVYKYGYIDKLDKITSSDAYTHYKKMIDEARIDIFVSGEFDNEDIFDFIQGKLDFLNPRINNIFKDKGNKKVQINTVFDNMDISQGKLVIGLRINQMEEKIKSVASVYNTLLGGSSNSKLFQNVREKNSLAYTIGSNFLIQKHSILIRGGIEIENYQKALDIIKVQIEDMKNGNFTEEDIQNAKKYISNSMNSLQDSSAPMIDYYLSQDLFEENKKTIDEYIEKINSVTKEQILELANNIEIDTIYFLTNEGRKFSGENRE